MMSMGVRFLRGIMFWRKLVRYKLIFNEEFESFDTIATQSLRTHVPDDERIYCL